MFWLPVLAAVVGAAFAAAVFIQFLGSRRPYQLVWSAALAMFAVAAAFEAAGAAGGWTATDYKGYYLFGGLLNVGWLGIGTLYLLTPRRLADSGAVLMGVFTVVAVVAVLLAQVDARALHQTFPTRASNVPVILPILSNTIGTLLLVGGAAWSAYTALRRRAPAARVLGTALIAAGALVVGADHSIAVATGLTILQPLSEAAGVVVMFGGYLVLEARSTRRAAA